MSAKRISILGATGSVGQSTLDLVAREPEKFDIIAVTAHRDVEGLANTARTHNAKLAVIGDASLAGELADALTGSGIATAAGPEAICDAAAMDADFVMASIVGAAGVKPVMAAIQAGITVGLANKESLVMSGQLFMNEVARSGAELLPIDSDVSGRIQSFIIL